MDLTKRWRGFQSVGMVAALLAAKITALATGWLSASFFVSAPALLLLPDALALCLLCAAPFAYSRLNPEAFLSCLDGASFFMLAGLACLRELPMTGLCALCCMPLPLLWLRMRYETRPRAFVAVWLACVGATLLAVATIAVTGDRALMLWVRVAATAILCASVGQWLITALRYANGDGAELSMANGEGRPSPSGMTGDGDGPSASSAAFGKDGPRAHRQGDAESVGPEAQAGALTASARSGEGVRLGASLSEKRLEDRRRNRTDELTGLLGRVAFAARLNDLLSDPASKKQRHAVLMIDLDGFKAVNDTYGHAFGDKVLIEVAEDLRELQRSDDLIARLGGDEYLLCLKNIPREQGFITHRCNVIRRKLSKSYGDDVAISASIGVAFYPEHGADFDTLYRNADAALYRAKDAGRDRYVIYSDDPAAGAAAPAGSAAGQDLRAAPTESAKRHTILIADDQRMNRVMLREIFNETYSILEAENGQQVLDILRDESRSVSAVVLDLLMPVTDGLEALRAMRDDVLLQTIPVVVVSAADEEAYSAKAIDLGAVDYVTKPIDSVLIRLRVRNAIVRRESENLRAQNRELLVQRANEARHQKQLRYVADHDPVTHVYNKSAFYRKTRAMLTDHPDVAYCIICFDILRFRAVNDIFGHEEGDRLLRFVAMQLQTLVGDGGVCSRVSVDLFVACMPCGDRQPQRVMDHMSEALKGYDLRFEVQLWYGIYLIDDRNLPINQMQDRAVMAERSVKGSYLNSFAYYDDSMSQKLAQEQSIINDMAAALRNNEFEVYYQPKCRLDTGKIVGAEALARWRHPVKGLLNPGLFVPVFERNGFIMRLDEYMWEKVCAYLAQRLQSDPTDDLRVSVNISRANLYNPGLCQTLNQLCRRYGVPNDRMEVEITESAYVENAQLLMDLTDQLHALGFTVEMDDFGSGYSSLNMLKEIPVDVLKLDMRFLYGIQNDARGGSILSSIIGMAEKLKMDVIAEGVETEEQARFLAGIGCKRAQGFYYHHPMPEKEFTAQLTLEKQEEARINDLESATLYLSRLLCSAALIRLRDGQLEMLCANEYYHRMMEAGTGNCAQVDRRLNERISADDTKALLQAMDRARQENKPSQCRFIQQDLRNRYHLLSAVILFVASEADGALYVVSLSDQR